MSTQPSGSQARTQLATSWASVEALFNKQRAYFASDATKSYEWRVDQLERLVRMLKKNYQRFADASCQDFKTASQENVFEVSATIATAEFAKSQVKEWMKPVEAPLPKFLAASGHKGMVYREPYGVTLIICPFNGPLLLSLRPAVAALSAGNPCILKLSEALLATDELLQELIPRYFEQESLSAVVGGRETVTNVLKFPFDFIFLTGSVAVGKVVMRAAAEHITPVLLELGGQNPAIVDETANIPDAAKKIVWGAMAWGGQWCTSPGYAVVHESVAEVFVAECKKAVVELYGANPENNPDYSRVISSAAVKRLASLIDPSKVVSDQYKTTIVQTDDGKSYTGRVVSVSDDSLTLLIDPEDSTKLVVIKKADIDQQQLSPVSVMPKDLLKPLNQQEVLDLLAYLLSRGNPHDDVFQK